MFFYLFKNKLVFGIFFFFSSRRRHTRLQGDWSSDVCSSDLLERERHNTIRSRNARFAAIRSFMHFAAFKDPTALPGIQRVLAIPMKRFDKPLLGFLSTSEIQAILDAPPTDRWSGQRDRIMFATLYNTGARVSELTGLCVADVVLDGSACVHLHGK